MSTLLLSIPADAVQWGDVQHVGQHSCMQTAKVLLSGETVCHVTLQWPGAQPTVPVLSAMQERHAGPQD